MKRILILLATQVFLISTVLAEGIGGDYEGKIIMGDDSSDMHLLCKSGGDCKMVITNVKNGGPPAIDTTNWPKPGPAQRLTQARLSLQYAKDHKEDQGINLAYTAIVGKLRPLLDSDAQIDECLDLDGKGGVLLCSLTTSPWKTPTVLFMEVLLANCGQNFCAYVIYPLFKTGSGNMTAASKTTVPMVNSKERFNYAFSFDARESPDVEILDYLYGNPNGYAIKNPEYFIHQGKCAQLENTHASMPRGEELYVKWRIKSTGQEYEDTVNLRDKLPFDLKDFRIHFTVKGAQLYVYLISPERRPPDMPPNGPSVYANRKTITIYPKSN